MTWEATYDGGSAIIDYRLYYDQANNNWVPLAFGLTSLEFTAASLTAGATYKFKVQAQNIVGYSAFSTPVTIIAAAVPSKPIDLSNVVAITDASQIALTWTEGYNAGSTILDYKVLYDQGSGSWVNLVAGVTTTSYIATGLTADTTYAFKVVARNQVGYGEQSDVLSVLAARIPDAPITLLNKPAETEAGVVTFEWTPDYNGGSPILDYRVSYDQGGGGYTVFAAGVTTPYYTATGLTDNVVYKFKVESRNIVGFSPLSAEVEIRAARIPDAPINLANDATVTDAFYIKLTWSPDYDGGSPTIDYRIMYDQSTGVYVELVSNLVDAFYTTTVPLTADNLYKFKVESRNLVGYSP